MIGGAYSGSQRILAEPLTFFFFLNNKNGLGMYLSGRVLALQTEGSGFDSSTTQTKRI